jgi:Secretion system C-terminal sorting domain
MRTDSISLNCLLRQWAFGYSLGETLRGINTGKLYENCERNIGAVQAQIISNGLGSLSIAQKLYVAALAQQCPAATGLCVYKARSIAAALNPGVQYNDYAACSALLPANKNGKNPYAEEDEALSALVADDGLASLLANEVMIYPNPIDAGNNITIRYNFAQADKVAYMLTDVTGKLVQSAALLSGNTQAQVQIPNLAKGIYSITIKVNDKQVHSQLLKVY